MRAYSAWICFDAEMSGYDTVDLTDIENISKVSYFRDILGYLNTAEEKQKKRE